MRRLRLIVSPSLVRTVTAAVAVKPASVTTSTWSVCSPPAEEAGSKLNSYGGSVSSSTDSPSTRKVTLLMGSSDSISAVTVRVSVSCSSEVTPLNVTDGAAGGPVRTSTAVDVAVRPVVVATVTWSECSPSLTSAGSNVNW